MPFDTRVEAHHQLQYGDNFMVATQQMGSKLRPYVTEKACAGEGAVAADTIQPARMRRRTERVRTNPDDPLARVRRWLVYRDPFDTGFYLDNVDRWRQIEDPQSELMMGLAAAAGRTVDDIILGIDEDGVVGQGGILGVVTEGKTPSATAALPSAQITVHGSAGLTIDKLRAARKRLGLDENLIAGIQPVMAITSAQNDDLLGIIASGSANYNQLEQPHIVEGKVNRLMGFSFINDMNRLPKAGAIRSCPVWLRHQVVLGVWQDIQPLLINDTHAMNTPHASISLNMDATRKEDLGVHVIECQES